MIANLTVVDPPAGIHPHLQHALPPLPADQVRLFAKMKRAIARGNAMIQKLDQGRKDDERI